MNTVGSFFPLSVWICVKSYSVCAFCLISQLSLLSTPKWVHCCLEFSKLVYWCTSYRSNKLFILSACWNDYKILFIKSFQNVNQYQYNPKLHLPALNRLQLYLHHVNVINNAKHSWKHYFSVFCKTSYLSTTKHQTSVYIRH